MSRSQNGVEHFSFRLEPDDFFIPMKIAQPFMAGIVVPFVDESRQGRQDFSFVPAGLDDLFDE